jgi:hypothetical protein
MITGAPQHYHPDFSVDAAPQAVNLTAARPSRNTHILIYSANSAANDRLAILPETKLARP